MRNWYTKAKFEKNDAGCTLELGHSLDPVLTINSQHRIAFWGMVISLPRIDVWKYTVSLFNSFYGGVFMKYVGIDLHTNRLNRWFFDLIIFYFSIDPDPILCFLRHKKPIKHNMADGIDNEII